MADFVDPFTEATDTNLSAHTPDTGTSWGLGAGSAGDIIVFDASGTIRAKNTTPGYHIANAAGLTSADHEIEVKTGFFGSQNANSYNCVRLVDQSNYFGHVLAGTGAAGRRLSRNVAGTIVDIDTSQSVSAEWIKVKATGTTVELYEGGTGATPGTYNLVHSATGQTDHQTEASCGLRSGDNETVAWASEFRATDLGGAAATIPVLLKDMNGGLNRMKGGFING